MKGINVSAKAIDTDLEHVFYRYGRPPAIIRAFFNNGVKIESYINSESELFCVFYYNGSNLCTHSRVIAAGVPDMRVLPQIVPLQKDEMIVSEDTLQKNRFSKRTSGNFRNNLLLHKDDTLMQKLKEMITETWSRLQIQEVLKDSDGRNVYLQMRDGDFVTEIYYMGHGIQMWLQTLWFIALSSPESIVILDEPDVYMHADLQRKLVRMLLSHFHQVIIATHSVEIISEVFPENILIVDRSMAESRLADDYPVLQNAISGLESIHNLALSRLLSDKKGVFIEGNDITILRVFYDTLFSKNVMPLDHIPHVSTGGWNGWQMWSSYSEQLLSVQPDFKLYFIFDRDYHTADEIDKRKREAQSRRIRMHIWARKEIENYVICESAIARFICSKRNDLDKSSVTHEVGELIENIFNELKASIAYAMADASHRIEKQKEYSTLHIKALSDVENNWKSKRDRLSLAPGKEVMKRVSDQCKKRYNVSFSAVQIAAAMTPDEIDEEVQELLGRIKDGV